MITEYEREYQERLSNFAAALVSFEYELGRKGYDARKDFNIHMNYRDYDAVLFAMTKSKSYVMPDTMNEGLRFFGFVVKSDVGVQSGKLRAVWKKDL